ncbi:hypothetical protein [Glutamicibacter sp. HZAU]|uniref:hypothetical protein n=1 Tax=Glutamicibacter sp. HZAU TaxID=2049891 RepID=UPI000FFB77AE|nr:hypothetical protein [Glutamicibacter sp. HZAU]RWZ83236.1 hypothetical protein EKH49_08595 [Glutamicibacter sp. HZAU]
MDDSSGFHFSEISDNAFDTVDTTSWEKISTEPAGAEIKHVLADPKDSDKRWFFKNNTVDERMRYGEDFAELLSSHLAPLLGIASATVYLAVHDGVEGIISLDVKPLGLDLIHGAVWLPSRGITDFVQGSKMRQGHSLTNIKNSLDGVLPPPGGEYSSGMTAFDAFAGICIFDAWIANQDRHEDNWAILHPSIKRNDLQERLSPIYDNASSLGFNLSEERLLSMTEDTNGQEIEAWAARAKAKRLERVGPGNRRLGLSEAAGMAFSMCTAAGKEHWSNRLQELDLDQIRGIPHQIPKMSLPRRKFIDKLLTVNLERIRDVCIDPS